jgi:hypothetical protein
VRRETGEKETGKANGRLMSVGANLVFAQTGTSRRQEKGDRRKETGERRQETGRRETGRREKGRRETGRREKGRQPQ